MTQTPEWKKLEQAVEEYFTELTKTEGVIYHRFMDTHAAGAYLPAQPGDHLVVKRGKAILIETKYSVKYASLASCFSSAVSDQQLMFHRLWARAGSRTFILFKGKTDHYELWDGAKCSWARVHGARLTGFGAMAEFTHPLWQPAMKGIFGSLILGDDRSFYREEIL